MPNYVFTSIIGTFVFDEKQKIIDKSLFKNPDEYQKRKDIHEKLKEKHDAKEPGTLLLSQFLSSLKNPQYLQGFRQFNLMLAKEKIKQSVNEDNLICQAISSVSELERISNTLVKRLREWYSLYNPEFPESISNNEKFVELILKKTKKELLKELHVTDSMGSDLDKKDISQILSLASLVSSLYSQRQLTLDYLENIMSSYCPNVKELAGITIAAKLLEHTGSLKKLALLPASTIQILGAEKALFRHMRTGARPPKYGLIHAHQFIQSAKKQEQGKRARALADKLTIAARVDYFKGRFIADKLKKELEKRFGK